MEDCIFCKIIKREIPANIVYENEDFLVFMDNRPTSPGHTLTIPKKHYRWVWDVENIGEYFSVVKKIALAQRSAFDVDLIRSNVYGEEVPHAHVSTWPETEGDKLDLALNAKKIIEAL